MKNIDTGTLIRTLLLLLALVNQSLIMLGYPIIEISEGDITTLVDGIYLVGSLLFTIITTIIAWFKNNYVTNTGKLQKEVLKKEGLTNVK